MKKTNFYLLFLLSIIILSSSLFSCEKEIHEIIKTDTITVIVTDTLIKIDTITITTIDTLINTIHDTATTFILIRHAETVGSGTDPNLSTIGQDRSIELKRILGNVPLSAVFATNYNRTQQTAQPIATDKGLSVLSYNPSSLHAFADANISAYKGETILVVGHSNTTPSLVNILVGANVFPDIPEAEYDNLFVVNIFEKGRASVTYMKYGE